MQSPYEAGRLNEIESARSHLCDPALYCRTQMPEENSARDLRQWFVGYFLRRQAATKRPVSPVEVNEANS
jgi:hypothetical protein